MRPRKGIGRLGSSPGGFKLKRLLALRDLLLLLLILDSDLLLP
jgi:hypothetical protein